MKKSFLTATLALHHYGVSAVPQKYSLNSTAISPPWPGVTRAPVAKCSNDCQYDPIQLLHMTWLPLRVTATYTAETVVFVVNKKTNTTRTTTISNTEIDFSNITTPTNLNSDGTVTASVIDNDGSTRVVAYPTMLYSDYPNGQSWTGTLSTTINGTPTCSIAPTGAVAAFPSHPLLPEGVQDTGVNMIEDPRGWTFIPDFENYGGNITIQDIFPGLGVWNCGATPTIDSPAAFMQTALYLTKTSTSTESGSLPTSMETSASITQPPVAKSQEVTPGETPTASVQPPDTANFSLPANATYGGGIEGVEAASVLLFAPGLVPKTMTTPAVKSPMISAADVIPAAPQPTTKILPVLLNPPTAPSESMIISPLPVSVKSFPTTPVAVQVPVTSTDSKGSITISTSTAIAHPIIASSMNAQGSIISSTSLSLGPITASVPTIITSTNAQGNVLSLTTHLPAIILTTTNAAGSEILTTSALSAFTPLSSAPAPIIVNSETITPNSQSQYVISSQTLSPGSSITLGSGTSTTVLALQTSSGSTALVYGPSTSFLPSVATGTAGTSSAALTIGSETITPNAQSQYLISGSTLAPGSTITVGSGPSTTVLALQTSDGTTALIYGPHTSVLTPTPMLAPTITSPPHITIGSETITANSQSQYIIGSQTLTPGGVVTVSGTRVSLAATGQSDAILDLPTTSPLAITIGSATITANSQTQYIIGSQTLTPGGVVTVSGSRVSLAAGESDVVVGSSTEALAPYITAGFGKGVNGTDGSTLQAFTGGTDGMRRWGLNGKRWWKWGQVWLVGLGVVVWL